MEIMVISIGFLIVNKALQNKTILSDNFLKEELPCCFCKTYSYFYASMLKYVLFKISYLRGEGWLKGKNHAKLCCYSSVLWLMSVK